MDELLNNGREVNSWINQWGIKKNSSLSRKCPVSFELTAEISSSKHYFKNSTHGHGHNPGHEA